MDLLWLISFLLVFALREGPVIVMIKVFAFILAFIFIHSFNFYFLFSLYHCNVYCTFGLYFTIQITLLYIFVCYYFLLGVK